MQHHVLCRLHGIHIYITVILALVSLGTYTLSMDHCSTWQYKQSDIHILLNIAEPVGRAHYRPEDIALFVSRGAVRSAASSYAAMRTVAGSRPVLVIV